MFKQITIYPALQNKPSHFQIAHPPSSLPPVAAADTAVAARFRFCHFLNVFF
jgi:hypothetical protein